MDQLTQEVMNAQQNMTIVSIVTISLIVLSVLVGIVVIQNRKIQDLQKPKFGFLGKPISAFLLIALVIGSIGLVYYSSNREVGFTDVAAGSELKASIVVTEIDGPAGIYQFNVLPSIDAIEWGGGDNYRFRVQWLVENGEVYQTTENSISLNNQGGVRLTLRKGTYNVSATIFIDDKSVETTLSSPIVIE